MPNLCLSCVCFDCAEYGSCELCEGYCQEPKDVCPREFEGEE
ncbi:hypothetical protein CHY_2269 [Carboxydothermus hydrogenoformans Z-2901]|uniref:Uncharacterized protein n=1 Tax=Carboxydothermus hydrogenoformans (strain ATCC BAA-161 / DSM 6008 / Z-2901) TaxID=246194 RepID=Q3A9V6_CARHZ|nr:hypothetical protein CHY_2269 [Carboxydothermus hydrogenoformans Z-2901]